MEQWMLLIRFFCNNPNPKVWILSLNKKAREAVSRLDSRQVIQAQRVSDWMKLTLHTLHDTRTALLAQHHKMSHHQAEVRLL